MLAGLGLFFFGMWLLSENLKILTGRRLRNIAHKWMGNPRAAYAWGLVFGAVTQSSTAATFILVSLMRSRLINTMGAFAVINGAYLGMAILVPLVTLDIKLLALYLLGIASVAMVTDRAARYRSVAACFLGGALIIFGLFLLKDSAAVLAEQPWFGSAMQWAERSMWLAFIVGACLTFLVQSSTLVCVIGVSMATVGVFTIDQTILLFYGAALGAGIQLYLLSVGFVGHSRQIFMYSVLYHLAYSILFLLLFIIELQFEIPLMRALTLSIDAPLGQQMVYFYLYWSLFAMLFMLATLGPCARACERLWPMTTAEELSGLKYIHDHAVEDVETSLVLVDLEQRRILGILPGYIDAVRQEGNLETFRQPVRNLLSEVDNFLIELSTRHHMQSGEGHRSILTRHKLISWLEAHLGELCEALRGLPGQQVRESSYGNILEAIDAVFLTMVQSLETGDEDLWQMVKDIMGDRSDVLREIRTAYLETGQNPENPQHVEIVTITNAAEQIFFLLLKLVQEFDNSPNLGTQALVRKNPKYARPDPA